MCSGAWPFFFCALVLLQQEIAMEPIGGRMREHVHLRGKDLAKPRRCYGAVMDALEIPIGTDGEDHLGYDELWIDALGKDQASATHVHLAFQAANRAMVDRFYKAGL